MATHKVGFWQGILRILVKNPIPELADVSPSQSPLILFSNTVFTMVLSSGIILRCVMMETKKSLS
jgi:hypothetical protein